MKCWCCREHFRREEEREKRRWRSGAAVKERNIVTVVVASREAAMILDYFKAELFFWLTRYLRAADYQGSESCLRRLMVVFDACGCRLGLAAAAAAVAAGRGLAHLQRWIASARNSRTLIDCTHPK
ncbi:unnamed protein product [Hapterophycus canaliculatus]